MRKEFKTSTRIPVEINEGDMIVFENGLRYEVDDIYFNDDDQESVVEIISLEKFPPDQHKMLVPICFIDYLVTSNGCKYYSLK